MSDTSAKVDDGLSLRVTHTSTGSALTTDAPVFHGGKGSSFSPTDLCEASLLTCTGTLLLVKAGSLDLDFSGMTIEGSHTMSQSAPVRIASLTAIVSIPVEVAPDKRKSLIRAAGTCPVRNSLHPDVKVDIRVRWADGGEDTI